MRLGGGCDVVMKVIHSNYSVGMHAVMLAIILLECGFL